MSKRTLSMVGSMLLSSAMALTATANNAPREHRLPHMPGVFGSRLMSRFAERAAARPAENRLKRNAQKPMRPDSGSYAIVDHPNTDPSWGTRLVGINEDSHGSGYYLNKDDGTFHAFLRRSDADYVDMRVGTNDTFAALMNDKDETFGSYIDSDTGLEQPWVRTKDGSVIAVQVPDGVGGGYGQFINNKGVLLGNYLDANGAIHCFTRTRKGVITEVPDAPNSGSGDQQGSQCIGINNKGDISGGVIDSNNHFIGYVRHADGTFEEFEAPNAGEGQFEGTIAAEIDEKGRTNGQVVDANDVTHGFIRNPDNTYSIVDTPDSGTGPGEGTVAVEHCEAGWCVGEYVDSNDVSHGYYLTKRGKIVEFDPPGAGNIGTYVVISSNKSHQITGTFKDDNAVRHGFIRNPQ